MVDLWRHVFRKIGEGLAVPAQVYRKLREAYYVPSVLRLGRNVLSVLSLNHEHDPGGLIDKNSIDALVT
jgi:hypothetical protein